MRLLLLSLRPLTHLTINPQKIALQFPFLDLDDDGEGDEE